MPLVYVLYSCTCFIKLLEIVRQWQQCSTSCAVKVRLCSTLFPFGNSYMYTCMYTIEVTLLALIVLVYSTTYNAYFYADHTERDCTEEPPAKKQRIAADGEDSVPVCNPISTQSFYLTKVRGIAHHFNSPSIAVGIKGEALNHN